MVGSAVPVAVGDFGFLLATGCPLGFVPFPGVLDFFGVAVGSTVGNAEYVG